METPVLDHFDLETFPFQKQIDDESLWLPPSKQGLVDRVTRALRRRENVLLCGEPGIGKTCLLRAVRRRLAEAEVRLTYLCNSTLSRRDFYRQLCVALDLEAAATAAKLFHAVSTHVQELGRDQIHPVLLIDEAHLLRTELLEHLHILLNYDWDRDPLLSLVLIGLPELEDTLERRRHRALYSRIRHRLRLEPNTPEDTREYIDYRLAEAGLEGEIFTTDAVALVHEASHGMLREIDRICQNALEVATQQGRTLLEREIVTEALNVEPLHQQGDSP